MVVLDLVGNPKQVFSPQGPLSSLQRTLRLLKPEDICNMGPGVSTLDRKNSFLSKILLSLTIFAPNCLRVTIHSHAFYKTGAVVLMCLI